ncbi:bacteriorhodopsin-like [Sphingomonas sp.]|uniref:bacteriorhodopsin-like n=1 Tax=Sphingomonas sp. TaxID=28214 RepID=UPI000BCD1D54|nr:bacteriorhodopsin-like [Sphingomonas sp.]MBA4760707.1 bacteriorhodopsin [Sphingomonas sp.]OYX52601.1 MAG: xanthorhodopsin [Sphingomonas sp. 32-66-10]
MDIVTPFQYSLIYNAFSFTFATMAAATAFLWLSRSQVAPAYRTALTISGLVTAIAAYHYWRIFESWIAAYTFGDGVVTATPFAFNDAYRYVDWLLTVPLLLIELVLVMRLSREETMSKSVRLGSAAALMIILGYPGEISTDIPTRVLWGTLSAIPFVYIVWELFSGLGKSIAQQPASAQNLVRKARLLTFASWGFYPIVYMAPYAGLSGGTVTTTIQVGYTIADIVAKAGLGILIFLIAVRKSEAEAEAGGHKGYAA